MNSNNLNEVKDDEKKQSDVNSNDVNSNTEMINNNNVLNSRLPRQESVVGFQYDDAHWGFRSIRGPLPRHYFR